jgi:hypothetical protein
MPPKKADARIRFGWWLTSIGVVILLYAYSASPESSGEMEAAPPSVHYIATLGAIILVLGLIPLGLALLTPHSTPREIWEAERRRVIRDLGLTRDPIRSNPGRASHLD